MTTKQNISILIARLIIGGLFVGTGWMKISDMAMTIGFFQSLGIPAFLAYVVGYAEFIGGILLILGLWIEITTAILAIIMIVAIYLTRAGGFPAFSTPLVTLGSLLAICAAGPGKIAFSPKKKTAGSM